MPILFALYRVFYNIPAYLPLVKDAFFPLVDKLYEIDPSGSILLTQNADGKYLFSSVSSFAKQLGNAVEAGVDTNIKNSFIDILNKFQSTDWTTLSEKASSLTDNITTTTAKLNQYNNFLGINIAESPSSMFARGGFMIVIALIIPLLAAFTQWLNVKLMPQAASDANDQAASTMKTMNIMMPVMSAVFCFSLPSGMGLYWILGAVVRSIQQVFINKHIDKMDIDEMVEKNSEKAKAKAEKRKEKAREKSASSSSETAGATRRVAGNQNNRLITRLSQAEEERIEEMNRNRKRPSMLSICQKEKLLKKLCVQD